MTTATPISIDSSTPLAALRRTPTATVANVIDLLKARPPVSGFADGRLHCDNPDLGIMAGFAVTATFRSAAPPPANVSVYDTIERLIAAIQASPQPAVVVIQDLDDPQRGACFGELMATAFKAFGAVGIVANSAGRDLDEVRALGLHTFTTGAVCAKACAHLLDVNVAVTVCGVAINPGDLVHGDRNGLLTLPPALMPEVARRIVDVDESEAEILNYFRQTNQPTIEGFAASRQRCRARLRRDEK